MKTTVHLHRPAAAPATERPTHPSTLRLGLMVSVSAALAAIVISVLTDVPTVAILIPVVVIGFTLSWHATGHQDSAPPQQLWPQNLALIKQGLWPQFYLGAFPYCYQIPEYKDAAWPPTSGALKMGQSPGTHWYHAHKHGSTAINVANGMTGVFIIEGDYDDN